MAFALDYFLTFSLNRLVYGIPHPCKFNLTIFLNLNVVEPIFFKDLD